MVEEPCADQGKQEAGKEGEEFVDAELRGCCKLGGIGWWGFEFWGCREFILGVFAVFFEDGV